MGITKRKKYSTTPITIKKTPEMDFMIEYLEDKLLLNPTAIMRYCLARVYEEEVQKDQSDAHAKKK